MGAYGVIDHHCPKCKKPVETFYMTEEERRPWLFKKKGKKMSEELSPGKTYVVDKKEFKGVLEEIILNFMKENQIEIKLRRNK